MIEREDIKTINYTIKTTPTTPQEKKHKNYLSTALLSTLLYISCAWIAQAQIAQIIDLEIPLIILITLTITHFTENNNNTKIYTTCLILAIILYFIGPQYSFIIILAMTSQLFITTLEKIFTNKKDYKLETKP
ncbi:MAG: hypothetical protein Q4Q23_06675 [Methanobacteriaceae archaeon]|nr:hypothetical protein [Methanobacteriaceae archaeon]